MYQPKPVPREASDRLRTFLEDELNDIALELNNEDRAADSAESLAFFMGTD